MPTIYDWKIGLSGAQIIFIPVNPGVEIEVKKFGRSNVEKRKFKVTFAHMDQDKRNALYAEFSRYTSLRLQDNLGVNYDVYWGECERSLDGTAHQPDKPEFGIDRSNMVGGVLRWNGTAIFSEV